MTMSSSREQNSSMEREMNAYQRGLVDTCLEEGQFEPAIAVLEHLRSTNYRPVAYHIRQLIYLSLQPEHPPGLDPAIYTDVTSSPSKTVLMKRSPSGKAVAAARRLLRSFAITNCPESIAQALPFCDDAKRGQPPPTDGSLESVIGPDSMCIAHAKSCWHILEEGFTQRRKTYLRTLAKGRKRAHNSDGEDESTSSSIIGQSVVGKDSWSVLEWLIILFERDEAISGAHKHGRHSSLLLQQIPGPRSGNGPRWDTEIPLRVAFYCLEQSNLRHQTLGLRLMKLLINLSSTEHLDVSMFVASVYSHLTVAGLETLPMLFSGMSASPAVYKFKVMICYKLLSDSPVQPRSQSRVQPRALYQKQTDGDKVATRSSKTGLPNNPLLPRFSEIQQLLENDIVASSVAISANILPRIKFELLSSYHLLQSGTPHAEKDVDWLASLRDSAHILELAFKAGDTERDSLIYRDILKDVWSRQ